MTAQSMQEVIDRLKRDPPTTVIKEGTGVRVLVTGACGFLGSHLVDYLMERDYSVIALDSYFTGKNENLEKWFGNPKLEIVRHDVCEPYMAEIDQIYHLACPASPVHYQYNPLKTLKTCFLGTMNMCGLAKRVKARILVASTSEVYGDPEVHPQTEDYVGSVNCLGNRACYDEGKRVAETMVMDYHRSNKVDVRIVRIFNTYGPRMLFYDGRVVSNFIVQALKGDPITLYGDGSQTRSFCYVSDLIEGIYRMMNQEEYIGPVNLGNPEEYSMIQLAEKIKDVMDKPDLELRHLPLPEDDPKKRKPDITRARKFLNKWQPTVGLEEGLRRTIVDFMTRAHRFPKELYPPIQKDAGGCDKKRYPAASPFVSEEVATPLGGSDNTKTTLIGTIKDDEAPSAVEAEKN